MKRLFALMLSLSLLLGMTACGKQETEKIQAKKTVGETEVVWSYAGENAPTDELSDLTEDVMVSLLEESYGQTRRWEKLDFDVLGIEQREDRIWLYFNLDATYRELLEGENPAMPLTEGEAQVLELPMRVSAEERDGAIVPESMELACKTGKEIDSNECSLDKYLPAFGVQRNAETGDYLIDLATITGELYIDADGSLSIRRMLWVNETHGHSDGGFFLIDLKESYGGRIPADSDVDYFVDASTVDHMPISEFVAHGYLNDRIFDFTEEFVNPPDPETRMIIIERYRP